MEGISGRVRRNVEFERELCIELQNRNQARVEEERDRARDRTVSDMEHDIDEYFDLGDEDVDEEDEIVQKFRRSVYAFGTSG